MLKIKKITLDSASESAPNDYPDILKSVRDIYDI